MRRRRIAELLSCEVSGTAPLSECLLRPANCRWADPLRWGCDRLARRKPGSLAPPYCSL